MANKELNTIAINGEKYDIRDDSKQYTLVSGSNIRTINGVSVLGSGNISISQSVDASLSTTSTNPVQNKAVASALANKADVSDLDNLVSKFKFVNVSDGSYELAPSIYFYVEGGTSLEFTDGGLTPSDEVLIEFENGAKTEVSFNIPALRWAKEPAFDEAVGYLISIQNNIALWVKLDA